MQRVDSISKKYLQLLRDMKSTERELQRAKKRGDQLQKEKESMKSELGKANSAKDKLEKLCRDTTADNKKLRVCYFATTILIHKLMSNRPKRFASRKTNAAREKSYRIGSTRRYSTSMS